MYNSPYGTPFVTGLFQFHLYTSPPCPFQSFRSPLTRWYQFQCSFSSVVIFHFYLTNISFNSFFHDFSPSYCLQFHFYRSPESILEFPVPMDILIIPITHCILPCHPLSSPIHFPCTPLCSYYPLNISPVFPCLRLSSPVHLLSPPVFSCHPLHMPLSPLLSLSSPI